MRFNNLLHEKALDDALVALADRLEFEKCNMRLKTDIKPKEATFQVVLDAFALTPFYHAFRVTADVPAIYIFSLKFQDKSLKTSHWNMTFSLYQRLGLTKDIIISHDGDVDYFTSTMDSRFATVINKCLSGSVYFEEKKHKDFWHTARDDTMFTSMRCISKHKDTQVYGTILPKELTNQAMLESNAYKTYYAFASGEKAPKPKYVRKKADPVTSPKQNHVQASKDTSLKSKAKVAKSDKKKQLAKKPKAKGLAVLSEGDSKDKDDNDDDGDSDDHDNDNDDERTYSDRDEILDPNLTNVDQTEHKEEDVNDIVHTPSDYEFIDDEKIDDEKTMDDEEDDEVAKELYYDVNVNLGNKDTDMTIADQGASEQQNVSQESGFEQVKEDAHVTLTPVIDIQKTGGPTQSSSVSSDFTSKLLNLDNPSPTDNEIASLMDITAQHATSIPKITSKTTTLLPALPYFAFVFKFNERDFNLEKDVSEIKQFDQQESQDEKNAYIELVDTSMGALIKEEVSQILPQAISDFTNPVIEKTVTESVEVGSCLTRRSRDNSDKDQDPSAGSDRGKKRRKFSKDVESSRDSRSKEKKSSSTQDALIQLRSYGKALPIRRIIAVTRLKIIKMYDYGHLEEIEVRRDDQKIYMFKEAVIFIKGGVEDLQLGVKSYQQKLNLTKPDTIKSNLRLRTVYTAYSNPKGVIYKDRMNRNRLMRTDELHKFSDGTLDDVRSALNDIAKGIRMEYLPMRKWSNLDKKRA
ncbi:hypothetical protein Tco_0364863 [Tanacetum coccineum]